MALEEHSIQVGQKVVFSSFRGLSLDVFSGFHPQKLGHKNTNPKNGVRVQSDGVSHHVYSDQIRPLSRSRRLPSLLSDFNQDKSVLDNGFHAEFLSNIAIQPSFCFTKLSAYC